MKLVLTQEQATEARKALADGAARFGADAILFGQVGLALAGEDHAGKLALFAITIPPATGRKIRSLLEPERFRLAKQTKGRPAGGQRECGPSTDFLNMFEVAARGISPDDQEAILARRSIFCDKQEALWTQNR
jgi:hypothetical protein